MSDFVDPATPFETLAELQAFLGHMQAIPSDEDSLSELEHGLQCADVLREWLPSDLELQVAGLVHDIGSALGYPENHGRIGSSAVRPILGERVAELVRLHVDAKRYLVTIDPDYLARLSPVSVKTLQRQGGLMDSNEVQAFAANPYYHDALYLRQADDFAKVPGRKTSKIEFWAQAISHVHGLVR